MSESISINQFMQNYAEAIKGRYGEDAEIKFGEIQQSGTDGVSEVSVTFTVNGETFTQTVELPELEAPSEAGSEYLLDTAKLEELINKFDNIVHEMETGSVENVEKSVEFFNEVFFCIFDMMELLLECSNTMRQITRETRNSELEMQMAAYQHQAESIREGAEQAMTMAIVSAVVGGVLTAASIGMQFYGLYSSSTGKTDMTAKMNDLKAANLELSPADADARSSQKLNELTPAQREDIYKAFHDTDVEANRIQQHDEAAARLDSATKDLQVAEAKVNGIKFAESADAETLISGKQIEVKACEDLKAEIKNGLKGDTKELGAKFKERVKEEGILAEKTDTLKNLKEQKANLEEKGAPEEDIKALDDKIKVAQKEVDDQTDKVKNIKSDVESIQNRMADKQAHIKQLDRTIELDNAFLEGAKLKPDSPEAVKAQGEVDKLKAKVDDFKQELEGMEVTTDERVQVREEVNREYGDLVKDIKEKVANKEMTPDEGEKMINAARYYKAARLAHVSDEKQVELDIRTANTEMDNATRMFQLDPKMRKIDAYTAMLRSVNEFLPTANSLMQSISQMYVQNAEADVKELDATIKQDEIQMNDSDQLFQNAMKLLQLALDSLKQVLQDVNALEKSVVSSFA